MLWKSGFFVSRSATHRYMRQPEQAGLHRDVSMYLYVAGRYSEMERGGIELRGRTGIVPRGTAGRHSEMERSGIELRDSENPEQILNFRRKSQMKIYEAKNYEEMSRKAASILASQITLKPDSVLGLATGSTPIGLYDCLVDWYEKGDLDFSQIKTVNLDEYKGLNKENDQSYYYFMHKHLFDRVNINPENTNVPDGTEMDSEKECTRYEEVIRSMGGVDIQLLGLGNNGHIGFNEPDSSFAKMTHCVDLTESTIEANKRFFASADDVPRQAYSMGIGTIMRAKKILLVANGEAKADALAKCLFGPVTPEMPGSILQFHNDVVVVADSAALSKIPR